MAISFMDGNEAIARGAMKAGCRYFAGYPITPATTIFSNMLSLLPPEGGICLQCEDEIASTGSCLGASMAGLKVMTATSGPGISLYSEHISFAIGSEIPIVIVNVQRLGPSTGSATRGSEGDIQFMRWGNSGGLPVIILAPTDVKDCYILTIEAFNLAERFRCPVFIASNKEIGMTKESVELDEFKAPPISERVFASETAEFKPFKASSDDVPPFLPIGSDVLVRQTSSTHGEDGYITNDPIEIGAVRSRLKRKIEASVEGFSFFESYGPEDADILLIAYGVTARAARVAFDELNSEGVNVCLLVLKTLWPVPEKLIKEKAQGAKRIIVVEMNLGQYVREVERIVRNKDVEFLGQMNGELIRPSRIKEVTLND